MNSDVSAQSLNGLHRPGYLVKGMVGLGQRGTFEKAAFTTVVVPCRGESPRVLAPELSMPSLGSQEPDKSDLAEGRLR